MDGAFAAVAGRNHEVKLGISKSPQRSV